MPMKSIDKRLDDVWSQLVKLKAGNKCEVCGKTNNLNSHHLYSRAKKSVRWDTMNGICLCVAHHIGSGFSAHKTPNDFTYWLEERKGKSWMEALRAKANQHSKLHKFEKQLLLKELQKEISYLLC